MGRKARIILGVIVGCLMFFAGSVRCEDMPPRSGKLKITSPRNGDVFAPGDKITVKAEYLGNPSDIEGVSLVNKEMYFNLKQNPPYEWEFTISKEFLGKMPIIIYVRTRVMDYDYVEVIVKTTEAPVKIEISPPGIILLQGEDVLLSVHGTYPNGTGRDITAFETGTTYSSSDPSIFEVLKKKIDNEYIVVTGKKVGKAKLSVTNGVTETIDVYVVSERSDKALEELMQNKEVGE